ncbi:MAG: IclR family transcriptional regulator [Syntrophothermus sp.]
MAADQKPSQIQSVGRALLLLEILAGADKDLGISEISRLTGLSKSTVHRLLAVLESRGFVEYVPDLRRYRLGLKSFEVGSAVLNRMDLSKKAVTPMEELAKATRETINLAVLDGLEVVYIQRIESSETLRTDLKVGRRVPIFCSALGKAILAFLPSGARGDILGRLDFLPYTGRTITSPEKLLAQLSTIQKTGYSLDNEEYIDGICCVGAPVFNHRGMVIAALSVAGPAMRFGVDKITVLSGLVRQTAAKISRGLGYLGPYPGNAGEG